MKLNAILRDYRIYVKYSLRVIRKNWRYSYPTVFILALIIGVNISLMQKVESQFIYPYTLPKQGDIIEYYTTINSKKLPFIFRSYFGKFAVQNGIYDSVSFFSKKTMLLDNGSKNKPVTVVQSDDNIWDVYNVTPRIGETFNNFLKHEEKKFFAVVTHSLSVEMFGTSDEAIGKSIYLDRKPYIISAVMDKGFRVEDTQVWIPFESEHELVDDFEGHKVIGRCIARFNGKVKKEKIRDSIKLAERLYEQNYSNNWKKHQRIKLQIHDKRFVERITNMTWGFSEMLMFMQITVLVLLLIGLINAGFLLNVYHDRRSVEYLVRFSTGASPFHLFVYILIDGLLLFGLAGIAALLFKIVFDVNLLPLGGPDTYSLFPTFRVFIGAIVGALIFILLFSIYRFSLITKDSLEQSLRDTSESITYNSKALNVIIFLQTFVTCLLMILTIFFYSNFDSMIGKAKGFEYKNRSLFYVSLPSFEYKNTATEALRVVEQIKNLIYKTYLQDEVSMGSKYPMSNLPSTNIRIKAEGLEETVNLYGVAISEGYFESLSIDLILGRTPQSDDSISEEVEVVVFEEFVHRYLKDINPINYVFEGNDGLSMRIVGIAKNAIFMDDSVYDTNRDRFWCFYNYKENVGYIGHYTFSIENRNESLNELISIGLRQINEDIYVSGVQNYKNIVENNYGFAMIFKKSAIPLMFVVLFVSIYGLVSISLFQIAMKRREISLKKLLGASYGYLNFYYITRFIVPNTLAIVFGNIVSLLVLKSTPERYIYEYSYAPQAFAMGTIAVLVLLLIPLTIFAVSFFHLSMYKSYED